MQIGKKENLTTKANKAKKGRKEREDLSEEGGMRKNAHSSLFILNFFCAFVVNFLNSVYAWPFSVYKVLPQGDTK
ncbi:hypothetical protein LQZ21_12135 [Treponema sp. TIM-1]|uniref:hypothetical protein n=1 Tax=Treponema sp. TIM-1 TaxID=2898417 RepID=UPI003980D0F7